MDIDMQVDVVAQTELVDGIVSKTFDAKLEDEYGSGIIYSSVYRSTLFFLIYFMFLV